jgi:hypothetical protein
LCYEDPFQPYAFLLEEHSTWNHTRKLTYSVMLTKVTELRGNTHWSRGGFPYPIRHLITDPNASINDHERALHFAAHPEHVHWLRTFGSHRLAVLPGRNLWDSVKRRGFQYRCWHSNQCAILFCYDCEGVQLDVVTNPLFWQDLKLTPASVPKELIHSVWHQQKRLPPAVS